jgi:hypothetical protein
MVRIKITTEKESQANIKRLEGGFRSDVHMVSSKIKDTDETVDIPHIGYGFKIDKEDYAFYNLLEDGTQDFSKPAYKMDKNVAEKRFLKEYNKAHTAAKNLAKEKDVTEFERIAVFTDLAYNMGTEWHLKFPSAMKALDNKDYLEFTKELLRGEDKATKSFYVNDVGIGRVTQNTLPFGYDHTEDYNSGALYQFESSAPATDSFFNMDTNVKVQAVPGNNEHEENNSKVSGNVGLRADSSLGFIEANITDHKDVYGKMGVNLPGATLTKDTDKIAELRSATFTLGDYTLNGSVHSEKGFNLNLFTKGLNLNASEKHVALNYDKLSAILTPNQISAKFKVSPDFVVSLGKKFQGDGDVNVGLQKNMEFFGGKLKFKASQTSGGASSAGINFTKTLGKAEGGEIGIPPLDPILPNPTPPSLTSPVLPNETVQPTGFVDNPQQVDTSEGFYKYNPAPNESAADFAARMPDEQSVETTVADNSSFKPPEGYVSSRISNPFMGGSSFGRGSDGSTNTSSTNTSGGYFPKPPPGNNDLSFSEQNALNLLGTIGDVKASGSFDKDYDPSVIQNEDAIYNILKEGPFSWLDTYEDSLDTMFDGTYGLDETYTTDFDTALDSSIKRYTDAGYTLTEKDMLSLSGAASASANIKKIMREVEATKLDTTFTFGDDSNDIMLRDDNGALMRDGLGNVITGSGQGNDIFLRNADGSVMRDANGVAMINTNQALMPGGGTEIDILNSPNMSELGYDNTTIANSSGLNTKNLSDATLATIMAPKDAEAWYKTLGDAHVGTISNTSIELRDLYDEFGATAFTYFITEDAGLAVTAGASQFIKSEGVRILADNAGDAAFKVHSPKINAMTTNAEINTYLKAETGLDYNLSGDLQTNKNAANSALKGKASENFTTYATGAATMLQTLAMGGTMEDAVIAGGQSIVTSLGAEPLGELLGFSAVMPADISIMNPGAQAVGGAAISAIVAFARTGDLGQAAISGATSYLMHVNPVLGFLAMGAQMIIGNPDPKNYAGYTALNLSDMSAQSYSHGDVDGNKASPENVKFTAQSMDLVIPIIEDIKQTYGITEIIGDIELSYGDRDGFFLAVTEDKDITGFTNRATYNEAEGELDTNKIFRRKLNSMEGLQNHVIELFDWAAQNMTVDGVLDLTNINDKYNQFMFDRGTEIVRTKKNDPILGPAIQAASSGFEKGGKILDKTSKVLYNSNQAKNYGLVNKKGKAAPSKRADDVPMNLNEGDYVLSQPAVNLYGKDTIERMVNRASEEAGTNLKSGGKVPVNVHNGEYIIPKNLTKYIGSSVLENMNNRGLMSVGDKTNT